MCQPARGVPASTDFTIENTVGVLVRLMRAAPDMMAMFTEYSPVLTMMPASRLLMPSLVCSRATTKPEHTPASMAAERERKGWPAAATMAPMVAPRVKQPSVDRSQTLSME